MPTYIKSRTERECNTCGRRCFAQINYPCIECGGTFCTVITPLPGKRVSGVLCRDKIDTGLHRIELILGASLTDMELSPGGVWKWPFNIFVYHLWTVKQWKTQYGKLPRKGSKSMVIIELTDGQ